MQSKVLITIDTESFNHGRTDAFEHDVSGLCRSNPRGAYWIAEEFEKRGMVGVFFLDVYGSAKHGGSRYVELCERLLSGGHDIQLHTHPDQMYDPKRRFMHEYTLAEQKDIIRDGIDLLQRWTGTRPIAHRAGSYGANEDTLRALEANRIEIDSSFFLGKPNCKLPYGNVNDPFKALGVWQLPVTIAKEPVQKRGVCFPYWSRHFWNRFIKLDVNAMKAYQLRRAINHLDGRTPYLITFLHSFSFVRRDVDQPDEPATDCFRAMLDAIAERKIPVSTVPQIWPDLKRISDVPVVVKC